MSYSICIQNTPHNVAIAFCHDGKIIAQKTIENHAVCANLISTIAELLDLHKGSLSMCSYLAVTQGPAPFSSLRTVLAAVHGIHIGTQVPLIGIDSLALLAENSLGSMYQYTASLLDAFNKELYYAIKNIETGNVVTGCEQYQKAITHIADITNKKTTLILGNGSLLYPDQIKEFCSSDWTIPNPIIPFPSLEDTVQKGWDLWNLGLAQPSLPLPLYLKKHAAEHK